MHVPYLQAAAMPGSDMTFIQLHLTPYRGTIGLGCINSSPLVSLFYN